VQHIDRHEEER